MKANTGWLFYKNYYSGNTDLEKIDYKTKTKKITRQKLSNFDIPDFNNFSNVEPLKLFTIYPGLLLGTGYQHESPGNDAFKIGFYFDYSTGLPVIPGSSVKGTLRSAFPDYILIDKLKSKLTKEKNEKKRNEIELTIKKETLKKKYIKEFLKEILGIEKEDIDDILIKKLENEIFKGIRNDKELSISERDIFLDAFPFKSYNKDDKFLAEDYITPHHSKGLLKNPVPLKFLKILPQVEFHFYFKLNNSKIIPKLTIENKRKLFEKILLDIGVGAKTNVGYGQFTDEKPDRQPVDNHNFRDDFHASDNNTRQQNPTTNMIERFTVVKTAFIKDSEHQAKIIEEIDGYFIFEVGDAQLIKKISSIKDKFERDKKKKEKKGKPSNYTMVKVGDDVKIVVRTEDGKSFTVQTDWS